MKKPKAIGKLNVSRRDFLRNAWRGNHGGGGCGGSIRGAGEASDFLLARAFHSGKGGLHPFISPNLYVLRDTCNVYVLKDGNRALLIDFGSGHVLNLLGQIGVSRVDAILHTHHHRDQGQGDVRAVANIPIIVPQ